jgi:hypothetical protein
MFSRICLTSHLPLRVHRRSEMLLMAPARQPLMSNSGLTREVHFSPEEALIRFLDLFSGEGHNLRNALRQRHAVNNPLSLNRGGLEVYT